MERPPSPTPTTAPIPATRRGQLVGVAVVAFGLGAGVGTRIARTESAEVPAEDGGKMTARGLMGDGVDEVSLYLSAKRADRIWRLANKEDVRLGDLVFFRVGSVSDRPVMLWVDGPSGRQDISQIEASPMLVDVTQDDELLAWSFDTPGIHRFCAAPADGPTNTVCISLNVEQANAAAATTGFRLPAGLQARDLDGRDYALDRATDTGPAVITFWSTTCGTCARGLLELQDTVATHPGATLVLVSGDSERDRTSIRGFIKANRLNGTVMHDADGALQRRLNIQSLPATLVVDVSQAVLAQVEDLSSSDIELVRLALDTVSKPTENLTAAP